MSNAMVVNDKDNVAVVLENIIAGSVVDYVFHGEKYTIVAANDIQIYHKIALRDIAEGQPVVKYGEKLGVAIKPITLGQHVHVHNLDSEREDIK